MDDDHVNGLGPPSLPAHELAGLRARNVRLGDRRFSTTGYLASSLSEQHHARRVARRLGLATEDVEAVVRWHLEDFVSATRSRRPSSGPSGATYGVVPRARGSRLLHALVKSPLVIWIPSFTSNRTVEVRAMLLRLGDFVRRDD